MKLRDFWLILGPGFDFRMGISVQKAEWIRENAPGYVAVCVFVLSIEVFCFRRRENVVRLDRMLFSGELSAVSVCTDAERGGYEENAGEVLYRVDEEHMEEMARISVVESKHRTHRLRAI